MQDATSIGPPAGLAADPLDALQSAIEHAAHLLPSQGPISVFVHHNTLHAFEELPFEQAVRKGQELYRCEPYLAEERYRAKLHRGRILPEDLSAVLLEELGDDADVLIGFMGTRYHLRLAMLEHPLQTGPDAELRWLISESDALTRFRPEAPPEARQRTIEETQRWLMRELQNRGSGTDPQPLPLMEGLLEQFDSARWISWSDTTWESFTLHLLWRVCHSGVHGLRPFAPPAAGPLRHRDLLRLATGRDCDALVHELLIQLCAAFLDQGFANWTLPDRDTGLFAAFRSLFAGGSSERWLNELKRELRRISQEQLTPLQSIADSLAQLGVPLGEQEAYVTRTLLTLPGWAGMLWQMETNAEWTVHPAPRGTLTEFLAVRLILDRLAAAAVYREAFGADCPLDEMRQRLRHRGPPRVGLDQRAYLIFQLAQVRGWSPRDLHRQSKEAWIRLVAEIDAFDDHERRRAYHLAYERRYRTQVLDAIALHAGAERRAPSDDPAARPAFQVVTCIDDREESFRRHLEEIAPACETYAAAGFFGVAMYFRGAGDAHFRPLCPVVIKPAHYVTEEVAYSLTASSRYREDARRLLGTASHRWHVGSRSFLAGIVTAVLGSFASIPLVARILFPRLTAQAGRLFGSLIQPPPITELQLQRERDKPGPADDEQGYSLGEMAGIVGRILEDIGLTRNFSRLVLFVGHGSTSLNNPHESAYNCGACSGGRGGPNARAFADMANDPRVRAALAGRGLAIPDDTVFVGGLHNTCDEDVVYYDLDRVPRSHRREFEEVRALIDEARARNAHERCRRFESADLDMTPADALAHVEERAEDLSQARPEYNHATNGLCFVGRRAWSRGLFLDRRAFLASYDPSQDDATSSVLARILAAAVPVCAGISLEYYFSCVDSSGYGCGSKLPHNITSLLGVMEGAASDLRPGLSQQMIEIHEPVRILFVIETTPERMLGVMAGNPVIDRLVRNEWVQLATLDPDSAALHLFHEGRFRRYFPESMVLPEVRSSLEWYGGRRDHLGFARIVRAEAGADRPHGTGTGARAEPEGAPDRGGSLMDLGPVFHWLGVGVLTMPALLLALLGSTTLLRRPLGEQAMARWTAGTVVVGLLAAIGVLVLMLATGVRFVPLELGQWVTLPQEHFHFHLKFVFDRLSVPFVILTFVLVGTIGAFANRYLHRDPGYGRFFLLYALFLLGMVGASLAGTIETLFFGWELVGLSSALLVAYFHERPAPVMNGFRVWSVYRIADAAFLAAAVALHDLTGTGDFSGLMGTEPWPEGTAAVTQGQALFVGMLLLVAAAGKSGLIPFSGWLPRAMEGPTPSSAVFYGALSVHLGAYLLLRVSPLLAVSPWLSGAVVVLGLATAVFASMAGRVQSDVKSALSFASLTQVGIITTEIGLGLRYVALVHIIGHACLRALQLLRAPTLLRDYHAMENAIGRRLVHDGGAATTALPRGLRLRLYRFAFARGHFDSLIDRLIVDPFCAVFRWCDRMERRWVRLLSGSSGHDAAEGAVFDPPDAHARARREDVA